MRRPLRVVVAEANPRLRSALRLLLTYDDEVRLVGEATDVDELIDVLSATSVDVLLVDWELPGWRPDRVNGRLAGVRVVGLDSRPERREQVLADGAHAFVSKLDSPDGLIRTLSGQPRYDRDGRSTPGGT
jgi:DNA-binding NarL/FixJ family response regulator